MTVSGLFKKHIINQWFKKFDNRTKTYHYYYITKFDDVVEFIVFHIYKNKKPKITEDYMHLSYFMQKTNEFLCLTAGDEHIKIDFIKEFTKYRLRS